MIMSGAGAFWRDERGATAIEYTMGAAFIAVAIVGAVGSISTTLEKETFARLNSGIVTGSIQTSAEEPQAVEETVEVLAVETTANLAAFEVQEQRMAPVAEWEPLPGNGPPIYTVSVAAPSCSSVELSSSCRPSVGQTTFQGWKGTRED
ncbi:MAG: Flp family type IVb pilin [Pseudomonadota bacterium]